MKRLQTLVLAVLVTGMSCAAPVKAPSALRKAKHFIAEKMTDAETSKVALAYTAENSTHTDNPLFYVYNIGQDNGFVIIAGDDRTAPVLGYSDKGTFAYDNMPDNLKIWMEYYKEAVGQLVASDMQAGAVQARPTDVVSPLLTTKWDQTWPYNLLCPMSGNSQCPTGCVATAMAQVLYYHKFPVEETNAIPAYYCGSLKQTLPALPATTFEWDKMKNSYNRYSSEESKMAVAKLMQYCGQAVEMGYAASSSGAQTYDLPWRLPRYFNYPETMHYVYHEGYSIAEWDSLLINELKNNRPVLYTAYTTAWEGHAFVCDGYDGKGLYHINWGWGGNADGYYRISVLDASSTGTGGSNTSMRFTINQAALLGLKTSGEDDFVGPEQELLFPSRPSLAESRLQVRDDISAAFPAIHLTGDFAPIAQYGYFSFGFALYDADGQQVSVLASRSDNLWQGYGSSESYRISGLGKDIEHGKFTIRPVYKKRSGEWVMAKGADRNYVDVEIDATEMRLTPRPKADFVVNSVRKSGESVAVDLTNNDEEYNGLLLLKKLDDQGRETLVAYEMVAIEPNSTRTYYIYVDPSTPMDIENDIFFLSVDAFEGVYFYTNAYNKDAELSCDINVINLSGDKDMIIGEKAFCEVSLSNQGTGDYHHFFTLSLRDEQGNSTTQPFKKILDLKKGQKTEMKVELPISVYGARQSVVATHFVGKEEKILNSSDTYDVEHGAIYWNAKGEMKACVAQDVLTVPEDALAIQLKNAYTTDVLPNDNPNTLYLLDRTIPDGLMGRNVLNADLKTGKITFTDGFDYFIPMEMNATSSISYSRTFGSEEQGQWSTICLPFSPTKIMADGKAVDWFRSPDDFHKSLWIQTVNAVENDRVELGYVNKMNANEPYLIAIGEDLVGKTLQFQAGKTTLAPTIQTQAVKTVGDYALTGRASMASIPSVYVLEGNDFVYNEAPQDVAAFRAYMVYTPTEGGPAYEHLAISGPDITSDIDKVLVTDVDSQTAIFDMSGRKVGIKGEYGHLPKGIYIIGGNKIVVK